MQIPSTLTPEQQEAMILGPMDPEPGRQYVLTAGPGSGKTTTLVARIIRDIATVGIDPESAVIVTFTNAAAGELRARLEAKGYPPERFRHIGTLHSLAGRYLARTRRTTAIATEKEILATIAAIKAKILGRSAARYSAPEIWRAVVDPPPFGTIATIAQSMRNALRDAGLTHHDLILREYADAVCDRQVEPPQAIYVDEYQDSAPIDAAIYRAFREAGSILYLIGDPRQAIYGFRGARPQNLAEACLDPTATTASLSICHRCDAAIVKAASQLSNRMELGNVIPRGDAAMGWFDIQGYRGQGDETQAILRWVAKSSPDASMAVICRYNSTARKIAAAIRETGFRVTCTAEPPPDESAMTLRQAAELLAAHTTGIPNQATQEFWRGAMASLAIPLAICEALEPRLAEITEPEQLLSIGIESARETAGEITVTTIHGAKGLEWDEVWIPQADAATFPIQNAEAARLLFVAITRARHALTITWAENRTCTESGRFLAGNHQTEWLPE